VSVGSNVRGLKVGERVGVAWMKNSCGACPSCERGHANTCQTGYLPLLPTVFGPHSHNGCFANRVRVNYKFVFLIPDSITSEEAAPLLCAGVTVYTPLRDHITRPAMDVAVIGIGGLGHLAIKMASHMGARVTAYSTSPEKEKEAKEHGAHRFVCLNDKEAMKKEELSQDIVLNTAPTPIDWNLFIGNGWPAGILRNSGKFILVGLPSASVSVPIIPLVFGHKQVIGSIIGGSSYMNEMFKFCATYKIVPQIEVLPMSKINEAIQRVKENKQRYRIVLKW